MPDPASTSVNFSDKVWTGTTTTCGAAGWPGDSSGAAGSGGADGDFSQAASSAARGSQRAFARVFIVSLSGSRGVGGRPLRERIRDADAPELLAVVHRLGRLAERVDPLAARRDGGHAALDEEHDLGVDGRAAHLVAHA